MADHNCGKFFCWSSNITDILKNSIIVLLLGIFLFNPGCVNEILQKAGIVEINIGGVKLVPKLKETNTALEETNNAISELRKKISKTQGILGTTAEFATQEQLSDLNESIENLQSFEEKLDNFQKKNNKILESNKALLKEYENQ